MISCNDILSPPLWVLPLVHSPQYLAHLWELAEVYVYVFIDLYICICISIWHLNIYI
jgi:hypothetical protein